MLTRHPEADARMARSHGLADYWPWLLRYPLTGYCLPVIAMLAVLLTLATGSSLDTPAGFAVPTTGLPLMAICVIWAVFYLVRVIDHTARGYATPPPFGGDALYLAGALKPLALPLMTGFTTIALRASHPALAETLLAALLFVIPAYLFIYATEERLSAALNPWRWLQLIAILRLTYLLPCGLLVAGLLLLGRVSHLVGTLLLAGLSGYLAFGIAHVLGYIGFKRQHALHLQVDVRDPDALDREEAHQAQLKALLRRLHDWRLAGEDAQALRAVESHGGGPHDPVLFFEALFVAVSQQGSAALIHATGRRLIGLLLAARRPERALEIAEHCLHAHRHFAPDNPTQLEALLRQALQLRFEDLYERLLLAAEADQHAAEPFWASVQFLRAQHQAESRRDDAGALRLLQPLRAMTQHPQHARFEQLARTLESLLERAAR